MYKNLNPTKALIFRIVHKDNLPWILEHGLHCRNSKIFDPHYVGIGNEDLIERRSSREVDCSPGGTLSDYVPFYFTPFSPMLFNIKTGFGGIRKRRNSEIVILASSLPRLEKLQVPFVFTDRHAYLRAAQFYSDLADLDEIDWDSLQRRDFKKDEDDPEKFERYQAEALVHRRVPIGAITGVVCYNDAEASSLQAKVDKRRLAIEVAVRPKWYF